MLVSLVYLCIISTYSWWLVNCWSSNFLSLVSNLETVSLSSNISLLLDTSMTGFRIGSVDARLASAGGKSRFCPMKFQVLSISLASWEGDPAKLNGFEKSVNGSNIAIVLQWQQQTPCPSMILEVFLLYSMAVVSQYVVFIKARGGTLSFF